MACCGSFEESVDQQFTQKKVDRELARYRRKGAGPTARLLLDGLSKAGLADGVVLDNADGVVLDIGAGVGALAFELLERGFHRALVVEASSAYAVAISSEASRRACSSRIDLVRGDFLDVAETMPTARLVTLDRVVCCYPSDERLLTAALRHAERGFAFSYPRDRWYVRAGVRLENAMRRHRTTFRTFVHPERRMRQVIETAGFQLVSRGRSLTWSADVFVKRA